MNSHDAGNEAAYNRLQQVITNTLGANVSIEEVRGAKRLDELVALDSVALLEFAVGVEREFDIRLEKSHFTREFLIDIPAMAAYLSGYGNGAAE